jgi:UDP-glucose 4-epimerase
MLWVMKVLVTGGAGYIGSTVCSALEDHGHQPVVLDSLVTGARAFTRTRPFYLGDIADQELLGQIFADHPDITSTLHFAARIIVPESVAQPALYYRENVVKTLALCEHLLALGQRRIVFSSSASVYASPPDFRVEETSALGPSSPYARTKLMVETMLQDLCQATPLRSLALRYFNPIGADPQLRSGQHVADPSHVLGLMMAAAKGRRPSFQVTGTDLPTRDGTGLRDYIHIWDLAAAHVAAVEHFDSALRKAGDAGLDDHSTVINIGTGTGVTVRELLRAFERVTGQQVPNVEAPPRPGDTVGAYASTERAARWLDWRPRHSIDEAIASALAWDNRRAALLDN